MAAWSAGGPHSLRCGDACRATDRWHGRPPYPAYSGWLNRPFHALHAGAGRAAAIRSAEEPDICPGWYFYAPRHLLVFMDSRRIESPGVFQTYGQLMPRLIVIAVLTLLCSACSRTEFTYRNADSLLEYYAWKTVRTSAAQRDHWQPVLQTTLSHHRQQELPLVIAYLDLAARIIREPEGSVGAECLVDGALLLYQRHARLAVDLAVPLLAELDAIQVEHLADYTTR